jgi:hypothetical protein
MKIRTLPALLTIAALAGCGTTAAGTAAKPPTCQQQYRTWKAGPALTPGKQLKTDLGAVSTASTASDIPAMTAGLKASAADVTALNAYPMPACADPHGYWKAILARVKAAGDNAGTSNGLGALILAEAPLKDVPALETKLQAELATTIPGVKVS